VPGRRARTLPVLLPRRRLATPPRAEQRRLGGARPEYEASPGIYADEGHDLERHLDYAETQIVELLENYGPIAGIWLDPQVVPNRHPERLHLEDLYETIHDCQPQTLVSYKYGITGTEDFVAPEHEATDEGVAKPTEICTTMIPAAEYEDEIGVSWGYLAAADGKHKDPTEVRAALREAVGHGHNLLLDTGPRPDGSIDSEDEAVLREVGAWLREEGSPGEA